MTRDACLCSWTIRASFMLKQACSLLLLFVSYSGPSLQQLTYIMKTSPLFIMTCIHRSMFKCSDYCKYSSAENILKLSVIVGAYTLPRLCAAAVLGSFVPRGRGRGPASVEAMAACSEDFPRCALFQGLRV